ncbi:MAG: peptidylprolyl isomerase [Candidatus Hydrogenedentes bacterium]|nr:peptidylprolyl isomerase [Candidatus Hydrogenedentota bacterium]
MNKMMAFAVLLAVVSAGMASGETVDAIVASVGSEVILQSELVQEIAPALDALRQTASNEAEFNKMAEARLRQALDQAIESKMLLREAMLAGTEIREEAVEEQLAELKKRFSSNEEFLKQLDAAGETMSDLRTRLKKQLLAIVVGRQKRKDFEDEVEVSEDDVVKYYNENRDKLTHPERVRVRRIFLKAGSDEQEKATATARMQELKNQLDAGASFVELAKTYSAGPDAEAGGLLGWVVRGDLVENLDNAAFSLDEGSVSDVLETEFGYVLLFVEKKEAAGTPRLEEARTDIEPELRAARADEKYDKWISELRKRSRVRVFI